MPLKSVFKTRDSVLKSKIRKIYLSFFQHLNQQKLSINLAQEQVYIKAISLLENQALIIKKESKSNLNWEKVQPSHSYLKTRQLPPMNQTRNFHVSSLTPHLFNYSKKDKLRTINAVPESLQLMMGLLTFQLCVHFC